MAFKWYNRAYEMGHLDSLLQVGLCFCFGIGIKQNIKKASDCFKMIITDGKPPTGLSEYDLECAHYWNAVLQLLGVGGIKQSVTKARLSLELANEDNDNDQANELLNLIGKSEYTKV